MGIDVCFESRPYAPDLHSYCVSYLKDFGEYYQISVCKLVREKDSDSNDKILEYMSQGLSRSEARGLLFFFRTGKLPSCFSDHPFVEATPDPAQDENEHIGRYINNIYRAKSTLKQLAACNEWDYFVTLTIDPNKFDRYDFKAFYKSFSTFKRNYKQNYGCKFRHVFVPERHKDGAWHLHGLIAGLPETHLQEYDIYDYYPYTEDRLPYYILNKLESSQKVYSWPAYSNKFGYTVVEELQDKSRAASYITKYVAKGFEKADICKNMRMVLPSLGLKRAELIKKGFVRVEDVEPSFDCDYATVFKFPKDLYSLSDLEKYFI